jgi:beta-fructofuranosidase
VTFKSPAAKEFGINVLCDKDGAGGATISAGTGSKTLTVGKMKPPFELKKGEDLVLRVFIDKNLVEIFANDRQAAAFIHNHKPEDVNVSLFSKGGDVTVTKVTAWKMKSIYK